jgi:ferric-dicitrate binding protein FerR (iron transport regulator)
MQTVEQQAARWLIQMNTADEITDDLWCFFERWLSLRPAHRTAYLEVERAWNAAVAAMIRRRRVNLPACKV